MTYYVNSKEGATDYILARPALVLSYQASGSIVAGKGVVFDLGGSSTVYQPSAIATGSVLCEGLALSAAATGKIVDVLVWGVAKNLPAVAGWTPATGQRFQLSGSSQFTSIATGSNDNEYLVVGTVITGSGAGGKFIGTIDCLK